MIKLTYILFIILYILNIHVPLIFLMNVIHFFYSILIPQMVYDIIGNIFVLDLFTSYYNSDILYLNSYLSM